MPVPRLRLGYVEGLYEVQGELRRAQDVVCTTDGEQLVLSARPTRIVRSSASR